MTRMNAITTYSSRPSALWSLLLLLLLLLCCLPVARVSAQGQQPYYAPFYSTRELTAAVDVYLTRFFNTNNESSQGTDVERQQEQEQEEDAAWTAIVNKYGPIEDWITYRIFDFSNLFSVERNPFVENWTADLSRWDVSNAESMIHMFHGASLVDFDVSAWNVSKVLRFQGMFEDASSFQGQGLERWDVSNAKYFDAMFRGATSLLPNIPLGDNWNVHNALTMKEMFYGATLFQTNLCPWAYRTLYPSVVTTNMLVGTACANTTDPNVAQRALYPVSVCESSCKNEYLTHYGYPHDNNNSNNQRQNRPPNVLLLMTDQQRYDTIRYVQDRMSHYNDKLKIVTPNLDKLLQSGAYFENAYCQCAVCAPARTTIRTGTTIERHGIQHNDLIKEYTTTKWFSERVQSLVSLDHVLVQQQGYLSEYYGKWHIPDVLLYSKHDINNNNNNSTQQQQQQNNNLIHYNDYNYQRDEFFFMDDSDGRKNQRYLEHFDEMGLIDRDNIQEGQQYDTYTGYPYTPIQLDSRARHQSPTGTPLTTNRGFEVYEVTQSNVLGQFALSEQYTPSHFTGDVANKALERLTKQSDPFFLTVSFHNPHPPMTPANKHLEYYWNNRDQLALPRTTSLNNSAYFNIVGKIPDYGDSSKLQEWTALYYALIEEIDEEIGVLLRTLGDQVNNTLVIFTSDHGEMLGAHGKREKNTFYEESSKVPLILSWPGKIRPNTKVEEKVSHLDLFATILDYAGASHLDNSDGMSLRRFIEARPTNVDFDEDVVFAEWDFRKPPSGFGYKQLDANSEMEDVGLDREIDDRPAFLIRKGNKKLMMQKLAESTEMDMMFDLEKDPFELNNLLGVNAMIASDATIVQAEHMRCLLLDWMTRLDGEKRYYSNPAANYGQGQGDITEIRNRQQWKSIGFWTCASDTNTLEMGRVAWTGNEFVRHEWLYLGTRLEETIVVSSISLTGADAGLFSVNESPPIQFHQNACVKIRVSFASPLSLSTTPVDASLVLVWTAGSDAGAGAAVTPTTTTIRLTMKDYDFDAQRLGYPPPPTAAPTVSPAPTVTPVTDSPTMVPSSGTTSTPVSDSTPSSQPAGFALVPPDTTNESSPSNETTTATPKEDVEEQDGDISDCLDDCSNAGGLRSSSLTATRGNVVGVLVVIVAFVHSLLSFYL